MAFPTLIILYSLFFALITWRRFNLGLFFLFLLLPTYLIRFNIGSLPATLLEIMIWIIFAVWLIKYRTKIFPRLKQLITAHRSLIIASALFLTAATISIFTSADIRSAAGEWKAFYIEPFLIFLILITTINDQKISLITDHLSPVHLILFALILSGLATSILSIIQHFTGFMVPWAFWENENTFRVTGWYGFPNAVGLFLAPLVPLTIYLAIQNFENLKKRNWKLENGNWVILVSSFMFLVSSPFAIFFAKSTSGLVGIAAGIGLLLLFYKKTRWLAIAIGIISLVSLFSLPGLVSLKDEVFFQDRPGQIRLAIYHETWEFLKDNPIFGAGLASYTERIKPYHTTVNGEGIEIFHHPHNIFLTVWVNLGIMGLIGFVWIVFSFFFVPVVSGDNKSSFLKRYRRLPQIQRFLLIGIIAILTTGLVDSPYIKNDLAILFWLFPALLIITTPNYVLENYETKKIG